MSQLPFGSASFPVFGVCPQPNFTDYQNQINVLQQQISDINVHIDAIEADLIAIQVDLNTINSELAYLNANAIVDFNVVSTYDNSPLGCIGFPVIDTFDAPTFAPNLPVGVSAIYNSRPLTSTDSSVDISYNPTCGFVNLRSNIDGATLTSAGSGASFVSDGTWPGFDVRSIYSSDHSVSVSYNGSDELDFRSTTTQVYLQSNGSGASLVTPTGGTGPNLGVKSLIGGTGITITSGLNDNTISSFTTHLNSLGTGESLVSVSAGPTISVKGLAGTGAMSVTQQPNTITISADVPSLTSAGGSVSLIDDGVGPSFGLLGLTAGSNVTLTSTPTDVTIYSDPTSLLSPGTGVTLVSDSTGPTLSLKSVSAGSSGLTLSSTSNDITLSVAPTVVSSAGGSETLVSNGSNLILKGLSAGPNISLTPSGSNITIAALTALSSAGTGASLVSTSAGPAMGIRSIIGSGGTTVSSNTGAVTLSSTVTTLASAGGTQSLVSTGTGPGLGIKGLTPGSAASFTSTGTNVTIAAVSGISSVGTSVSLVSTSTGPSLSTKGLTAGTGITMSATSSDITITPSFVSTTLAASGTGTSLVASGVAPTFTTKSLVSGGPGFVITDNGTSISFSNPTTITSLSTSFPILSNHSGQTWNFKSLSSGTGMEAVQSGGLVAILTTLTTLATSGTGNTLISSGTGPSLSIKGLTAGAGISLTSNGSTCTIGSSTGLTSAGGSNSLIFSSSSPGLQYQIYSIASGSGILLSDTGPSIKITPGAQIIPAYGEIGFSAANPASAYVLGLTPTLTVVTPGTSVGATVFNFSQLSNGVLQYTESQSRFVFVQVVIDLQPTDGTNYFIFQLRLNGSTVLDTANTFTAVSFETISLQAVVYLNTNDTLSVYGRHSGSVGTINTNIIYFKITAEHHQFGALAVTSATGSFNSSSGITALFNRNVMIIWQNYPTVHTNAKNLLTLPTPFIVFNATQTYNIKFSAVVFSAALATMTPYFIVNGTVIYNSTTFTSTAQLSTGVTVSVALNPGDVFVIIVFTTGSGGSGLGIRPTLTITT